MAYEERSEARVFEGQGWKVICGRWQDSPPEQVDHVISDPPFHKGTHDRSALGFRNREVFSFEAIEPAAIVPPILALCRRWCVCFCAFEALGAYEAAAGERWVRSGYWDKTDPAPQFTGDRPGTPGEGIAIMHAKQGKRWNGGGKVARWRFATVKDERQHETQKPLDLMMALIEDFTDPGDLVWDPYGGSMTTGVACLMLGRRFIGHEMQARYAEVGAERLRAAEQGLTLSAARAGQMPLFGSEQAKAKRVLELMEGKGSV